MSTLNIDTFNEILLKAAKDEESKRKIIEAELHMAAEILHSETFALLDELAEIGYESEQFQKIQNIKSNCERLLEMLGDLPIEEESEE